MGEVRKKGRLLKLVELLNPHTQVHCSLQSQNIWGQAHICSPHKPGEAGRGLCTPVSLPSNFLHGTYVLVTHGEVSM